MSETSKKLKINGANDIRAQLLHAAKLARVRVMQDELDALCLKAKVIFESFDRLSEVQTDGLDPLYTFQEAIVMRDDFVSGELDVAELMLNAPRSESNHFVVPRAVGGDDAF